MKQIPRTRIHYGWIILLLAFLAIATGTGVRLAFGSFVNPWEQEFSVTRSVTSLIATASFVVYGLAQPVAGRLADRRGPGGVLAVSLLAVALGLLLTYVSHSVWTLGLAYGLVASVGFAGVSQVTGSVAVTRWFQERRGLAMACVTLASSVGQMTLVPASIFLNSSWGWRPTVLLYAAGLAALAPLIWWRLMPSPGAAGLLPYGATGPVTDAETTGATSGATERGQGCGRGQGGGKWQGIGQVLATPNFWWLALPFFVCGVTTTGLIDTHLVPFAHESHIPQGATALAVVLLAGFNSLGVMLSGHLTDRVPRRYLLAFLYGMRGITLLFLLTVSSGPAFLLFSVVYGLVDFATVPPTISLSAELMGSENVGMVYGLISLSHQLGSASGAFVPGLLHDLTHGYQSSFLLGAVSLVVATGLTLWIREKPHRGNSVTASAD